MGTVPVRRLLIPIVRRRTGPFTHPAFLDPAGPLRYETARVTRPG